MESEGLIMLEEAVGVPHCVGKARLSLQVAQTQASAKGGACLSTQVLKLHGASEVEVQRRP